MGLQSDRGNPCGSPEISALEHSSKELIIIVIIVVIIVIIVITGCTQIPISTLSHIWVFVRLYGIVFVIIVIIIIIIMIIKSEGVNAQL